MIVVESATSPSDVDVIGVFESFAVACEQVGILEAAKPPDDLREVDDTWRYSVKLYKFGHGVIGRFGPDYGKRPS